MKAKVEQYWMALFLSPALILFLFVYLASIVSIVGFSFTDWRIGQEIRFSGIRNYLSLFQSSAFLKGLGNTIIWILLQSTLHVAIGVIFCLIISWKKNTWYAKASQTLFMLPNMLSSAALGMLFYNIFNPMYGPVNKVIKALGGVNFNVNWFANADTAFFAVTATWLPFAAVIAILGAAELSTIPDDIFEAASIDGATELQASLFIKLPLLKNAIGAGTILAATSMLQKLDILVMTTNGGPGIATMNLPLFIYNTAMRDNNFGLSNACSVLLIIIGLISIGAASKMYRMHESASA